ncbi:hypothetical protein STW0522KLE44_11490 [Klebsiella sp. STW0522-44]|nr:hypothetical protein STW0522KLE44_11490 [Klebsiella sp. STW0522-44]
MTAKYLAILTNQGAARLANAAALGTKLNLTQMAVGDANGTLPTPDPAQTKLINQKRIAPLNLLTVDPANTSQIIAEQIIPENEGGFWIREIGLYDDDGILIAVANCPETYKPELQEGSGRTQTIRMILIVSSTSSITLKIDPSVVLATRKYADDKAIELKLYVDDLMSKHLAAADPHSQYATKDSPTFTGKPKAPTPPVVANDTQVATAGFVQAVIAALVSGELANKQPLDKTLTDLSGKDVAAILEYLGFSPYIAGLIDKDNEWDTWTYLGLVDGLNSKQKADATLTELSGKDVDGLLQYLGLGNTKYGAPLIGQLIEWPLQKMPHEIWPDMGQEYIPYMAQSFDPVKYPLLSQLHPTNVLPADMRGYGVRGWDNARGVDTGRALMSAQSSGAPNLTGTVQNVVGILGAGSTGAALGWTPGGVASTAKAGTDSGVISIVMDASKSSKEYQSITEVRSKNVAWNMIVRAK